MQEARDLVDGLVGLVQEELETIVACLLEHLGVCRHIVGAEGSNTGLLGLQLVLLLLLLLAVKSVPDPAGNPADSLATGPVVAEEFGLVR